MADLDTLRPEMREDIAYLDAGGTARIAQGSWSRVRAELLRLAKENRILEVKNAGTLANNLCPDHRDKQGGHRCLACLLERAEAELDALKNLQYELAAQVTRANNAEAELAESRETIKRLNRRVQVAEAGVAEKVKASGGSLGRALANAAASKAEAELAALKARIASAVETIKHEGVWADGPSEPYARIMESLVREE